MSTDNSRQQGPSPEIPLSPPPLETPPPSGKASSPLEVKLPQQEEKSGESGGYLEAALASARIGTGEWDLTTGYFSWSSTLHLLFGLAPDTFNGTFEGFLELVSPPDRMTTRQAIEGALEEGRGWELELGVASPAQNPRCLALWGYLIRDEKGQTVKVLVLAQDITARKKTGEEVRLLPDPAVTTYPAEREAVQSEIERRLGRFVEMASHELRTPLTAIRGFAQILEKRLAGEPGMRGKEELEELVRKGQLAASTIYKQSQLLGELVNRLLDFSRLGEGRLELVRRERVDLVELVREVAGQQGTVAEARSLTFQSSETEIKARVDEARLEEVLNNLIGNALKFSFPPTSVAVRIERHRRGRQGEEAIISVKDEGPGISVQDQTHLFDRFLGGQNPGKEGLEGLGLGLYICREIIELHGGRIWVESEPQKGSTFYVALPLEAA